MKTKILFSALIFTLLINVVIFSRPPKRPNAAEELKMLTGKLTLSEQQINIIEEYLIDLDETLEKYEKTGSRPSESDREKIHQIIDETNELIMEALDNEQQKIFEEILDERKKRHEMKRNDFSRNHGNQ